MSVALLKTELQSLERVERCQIIGFLFELNQREDDPSRPARTASMLNDSTQWTSWDEAARLMDEADARDAGE